MPNLIYCRNEQKIEEIVAGNLLTGNMRKSKEKREDFTISREILDRVIRKRKKDLPKLYTLTKTQKGREKNFQMAIKIFLTFDVKNQNQLLEGMENIIRQRRLKQLDKVFYSVSRNRWKDK